MFLFLIHVTGDRQSLWSGSDTEDYMSNFLIITGLYNCCDVPQFTRLSVTTVQLSLVC